MIDVRTIRSQFPIFKNNPKLVYLDTASSSLTPEPVIKKLVEYYENYPVNVKRGIYSLGEKSTAEFEKSREVLATFINANESSEVIFTRGATESINLVAYAYGRANIDEGDEVVVSVMDHHSNFVPWQALVQETGAVFKVIDIDETGRLNIFGKDGSISLDDVVTKRTKILALTYVSNVLGTVNPLKEIIKKAKAINPKIIVVVDAAQAAPHLPIDVQDLDCDFLALSGHKMYGPKGVGILWGRKNLLVEMFPFQYGGEMIHEVQITKTSYAQPPHKFEAGTPAIADVIALQEAVYFLKKIGFKNIQDHETSLMKEVRKKLQQTFRDAITLYGPENNSASVVSFSLRGSHPHDIASMLSDEGVCLRAGHHCTMPLHTRLGVPASSRVSISLYNNSTDIDRLIAGLLKAYKTLTKA